MDESVNAALVRQRLVRVLCAGVLSGLMSWLPAILPALPAVLLSQLAALPLLIYGLRFGWQAVMMAGVAGWGSHGILSTASSGFSDGQLFFSVGALIYLVWNVAPALLASWLIGLGARPALVLTGLAASGAASTAALSVFVPGLSDVWREVTATLSAQMQTPEMQTALAEARIAEMAPWLPGLLGVMWLSGFAVNLALASRFIHASGFGDGVPRFADLRVSQTLVLAAAGCLVTGSLAGAGATAGIVLLNAGVVLLAAIFLGGLALVHTKAAQLPQPGVALMLFYFLSLLLALPLLIVLAAGAADAFFDFRNSSFRSRS